MTRQGQAGSGHTAAGPASPHAGSATVVTRGLWRPARWASPATAAENHLSIGCQQSTMAAFPGVTGQAMRSRHPEPSEVNAPPPAPHYHYHYCSGPTWASR